MQKRIFSIMTNYISCKELQRRMENNLFIILLLEAVYNEEQSFSEAWIEIQNQHNFSSEIIEYIENRYHQCEPIIIDLQSGQLLSEKEILNMLQTTGELFKYLCYLKPLQIFGLYSSEYIQAFASYLQTNHNPKDGPIIEVGAGDGRLSSYLQEYGVPVIATDFQAKRTSRGGTVDEKLDSQGKVRFILDQREIPANHVWSAPTPFTKILRFTYQEALIHFQPSIIIASWMPLGSDWTTDFREYGSVRQYLVIGEGEGGCTGSPSIFSPCSSFLKQKLFTNVSQFGRTTHIPFIGMNCTTHVFIRKKQE